MKLRTKMKEMREGGKGGGNKACKRLANAKYYDIIGHPNMPKHKSRGPAHFCFCLSVPEAASVAVVKTEFKDWSLYT